MGHNLLMKVYINVPADITEEKRGRGKNKCKNLAKLKPGQKIKVMFYNNRALGTSFARHIGRIVRDPTITPVRVKKWIDISETSMKHIFAAVKVYFHYIVVLSFIYGILSLYCCVIFYICIYIL